MPLQREQSAMTVRVCSSSFCVIVIVISLRGWCAIMSLSSPVPSPSPTSPAHLWLIISFISPAIATLCSLLFLLISLGLAWLCVACHYQKSSFSLFPTRDSRLYKKLHSSNRQSAICSKHIITSASIGYCLDYSTLMNGIDSRSWKLSCYN